MRISVCRLIPQRPACDTTSDAAPARDRCHLKASQTPRDSVLSYLARRQPSASESAPSQAFSRTPTGRSYPRKGSSADCVVRSSRTLPILLLLQIAIQRAQRHAVTSAELFSSHATRLIQPANRSISARPRRPTTAPDSPPINRVHNKSSAPNRCVPRTLTEHRRTYRKIVPPPKNQTEHTN